MNASLDDLKKPLPAHTNGSDVADWEMAEEDVVHRPRRQFGGMPAAGWAFSDRLDHIFPPYKRYFGRSRRTFLVIVVVVFLFLLALIIGLSVGLTKKSTGDRNLPLPDDADTYTGDLTYYEPALGACGITSTSNDAICAVSHYTFDAAQTGSDPNQNPLCGRKIRAQRFNNGETVSVDLTVVDRCAGCEPTDIDVSIAMFKKLADPDLGRVPVTWAWL